MNRDESSTADMKNQSSTDADESTFLTTTDAVESSIHLLPNRTSNAEKSIPMDSARQDSEMVTSATTSARTAGNSESQAAHGNTTAKTATYKKSTSHLSSTSNTTSTHRSTKNHNTLNTHGNNASGNSNNNNNNNSATSSTSTVNATTTTTSTTTGFGNASPTLTYGGGFRTVRANIGVSSGNWYFEVLILPHPFSPPHHHTHSHSNAHSHAKNKVTLREILHRIVPNNVRLGESLKQNIVESLVQEEMERLASHPLTTSTLKPTEIQERVVDETIYTTMIPKQIDKIDKEEEEEEEEEEEGEEDKEQRRGRGGNTNSSSTTTTTKVNKKRKTMTSIPTTNMTTATTTTATSSLPPGQLFRGGHVRIGWSMRTGELQAPVGYDQWSYGFRDIMGSRIHNSRREDKWYSPNGEASFGPGDVVGFAICLVGNQMSTTNSSKAEKKTNHIRFFKNGEPMGHFVVSRTVRSGGEAFHDITPGTYYPAISSYMGGSARVNFGPYFIYPPRPGCLPTGMKVRPMCEAYANSMGFTTTNNVYPPPPVDEALALLMKEKGMFSKKTDENIITALREAARVEASLRYESYREHMRRHVDQVRSGRVPLTVH